MTKEVSAQARATYEAPTVADLGAVDEFSQGDNNPSNIDDLDA
jgi:hypothetical protein